MTKYEVEEAIKSMGKSKFTIFYNGYGTSTNAWRPMSASELSCTEVCLRHTCGAEIDYESIISIKSGAPKFSTELMFGSDPEMFFVKNGVMIPSTQILLNDTPNVTRDGFQVELHPSASGCRQLAARSIKYAITDAAAIAERAGAELSFALSHVVDDKVWKKTPSDVKKFGCNPTENVHEKNQKRVTGKREKFRAGGGHIHVGALNVSEKNDLPTIVKLFDIVVGNTLVLLDRDPANITRRKNYGRAGEYRPKPYGVEYRVPSNFWLRHYVLWSLASGLIRNAMVHYRNGFAAELIAKFDMKDIRNAINNNDYELAHKNYLVYIEFLKEKMIPHTSGISVHNYDKFDKWLAKDNPIALLNCDTDEKIVRHWSNLSPISDRGFEGFINNIK